MAYSYQKNVYGSSYCCPPGITGPVGPTGPTGACVCELCKYIYTYGEDALGNPYIYVVNSLSSEVIKTIPVNGRIDKIISNDENGFLYALDKTNNTVDILSGETNQIVNTLSGIGTIEDIAVDKGTGKLYVATDTEIRVYDKDGTLLTTIPATVTSLAADPGVSRLYGVNGANAVVIDTLTDAVIADEAGSTAHSSVAVSDVTGLAYYLAADGSGFDVTDDTGVVSGNLTVTNAPVVSWVLDAAENKIYYTTGDNNLYSLDLADGVSTVVAVLTSTASRLTFDAAHGLVYILPSSDAAQGDPETYNVWNTSTLQFEANFASVGPSGNAVGYLAGWNDDCMIGPAGPQGPEGAQGATGAQGPQGAQGVEGPQGDEGGEGPTGPQGAQGIQGEQGPAGATGATGQGIGVLGAYDNYADFISDHPTGTPGDAWLVDGNLLVADENGDWISTGVVAGPQGIQGPVGPTGAQGPQGAQGERGATGATGPQGAQGPQGPQGIQGEQGAAGATGATGHGIFILGAYDNYAEFIADHPTGSPGDAYLVGDVIYVYGEDNQWHNTGVESGPQGIQGPVGPTGAQGPQGAQGIEGPTGPEGPQGVPGPVGPTGPVGATGATGAQGPQGVEGPQGIQGAQGAEGSTGPQGAQGIQGEEGPAGATGATGQGIEVLGAYDDYTSFNNDHPDGSGNPGDAYIVGDTIYVYGDDGVWHETAVVQGPKGDAGDRGPTGPQGPMGQMGPQGTPGPQGIQGVQGQQGAQGIQGEQGPAGPTGATGQGIDVLGAYDSYDEFHADHPDPDPGASPGDTYIVGDTLYVYGDDDEWHETGVVAGPQGIQGPVGPTGAQGPQGLQGSQGVPGPRGNAGLNGATGPQGATGPAGATGAVGPQGPQGVQGPEGEGGEEGPVGPQGAQGIQGEEGPAGATGATGQGIGVLGAYDNYADFIADHPTGTPGDAWLVDGNLLVADENGDWISTGVVAGPQGIQGPVGPTGAQGPMGPQGPRGNTGAQGPQGVQGPAGAQGVQGEAGAAGPTGPTGQGIDVLGAYDNITDFEAEHPTPDTYAQPGDAYLVGDTIYVYGSDNTWHDTGVVAGPQGIQGPVGPTGAQGPQGSQGLQGPAGPQGPAGADGSVGATGAVGPTGPTGAQGPQGAQGAQGIQGEEGDEGPTGPQGAQGIQGEEGPAGATGATGQGIDVLGAYDNYEDFHEEHPDGDPTANPGDTYIVGDTIYVYGDDEVWHETGVVQGPQGLQGPVGPTGPQGPMGPQGPRGNTGADGPQGAQGAQGAQGIQGEMGPAGPTGATGQGIDVLGAYDNYAEFEYDHPTPDDGALPGDAYLVGDTIYVYGSDNEWHDTGIIAGPQGIQGPVGPTGAQGPQGAQGSQGVPGPKGNKGDEGATGPQGPTGPQGTTGAVGPQGPEGIQGIQGIQGEDGPTGPQGAQGVQGEQGAAGATGATGQGIVLQGAYDSYINFIADHPNGSGTPGDAYVVGDYLYVADENGNWVNTGITSGPQGATGPQGPTGAQGPMGPQGDQGTTGAQGIQGAQGPQGAQGVQGEMGPAGPTGATGQGIDVLGAYDNYEDFHEEHPDGDPTANPGDTYIVGDTIYVYGDDEVWHETGVVQGPQGEPGPQGPTGAQGPQGAQGLQGVAGPRGETGATGPSGPTGDAGATGEVGPTGATGPRGQGLCEDSVFFTVDGVGTVIGTDPATYETVTSYPGIAGKAAVNSNTDQLFIANQSTLAQYDALSGTATNSVALPGTSAVKDITVDPCRNVVFVSFDDGTTNAYDATTLSQYGSVDAAGYMYLSACHRYLFIHDTSVPAVQVVRPSTGQVVDSIPLGSSADGPLAVSSVTHRLYVGVGNDVEIYDSRSGAYLDTVAGSSQVTGLTIDPATNTFYILYADGSLSAYSGTTDTLIESFAGPYDSITANAVDRKVYATLTDGTGVDVIDTVTNSVIDTIDVDGTAPLTTAYLQGCGEACSDCGDCDTEEDSTVVGRSTETETLAETVDPTVLIQAVGDYLQSESGQGFLQAYLEIYLESAAGKAWLDKQVRTALRRGNYHV